MTMNPRFLLLACLSIAVSAQLEPFTFLDIKIPLLDDLNPTVILEAFTQFIKEFGKIYPNPVAYANALKNFGENLKRVIELNTKFESLGTKFGINQYNDLTTDEFKKLLIKEEVINNKTNFYAPDISEDDRISYQALPATYDWRNYANVVGPVRSQGGCGCCWAFASAAVVQSAYAMKYKKLIQPSDAQLCDCGMGQAGCNGGNAYSAFNYVKTKGMSIESSYPLYTDQRAKTYSSCEDTSKPNNIKIASYAAVSPKTEEAIKKALYLYGPMYIAIKVGDSFRYYKSGVFSNTDCDQPATYLGRHAMTLIGYNSAAGVPYWVIKNSWNTGWGQSGYIHMRRGTNICGLETNDALYVTF